jgi:hypothetical protein
VLSVLAFPLAMAAGIAASLLGEGRLPSPAFGYVPQVKQLVRDGHYEQARRQLRLALVLDGAGAGAGAAPVLLEVARSRGDVEDEILALRILVRSNPRDARSRMDLAAALLGRARALAGASAPARDLREAGEHARAARALAPRSARARALADELDRALGEDAP